MNEYCGDWEKFEFSENWDFQTTHIRDFLRTEGILGPNKNLTLKALNGYLVEKLKLQEKPFKRRNEVLGRWDEFVTRLQPAESET